MKSGLFDEGLQDEDDEEHIPAATNAYVRSAEQIIMPSLGEIGLNENKIFNHSRNLPILKMMTSSVASNPPNQILSKRLTSKEATSNS